ncbi:MAG: hypothetical protein WAV73_04030 [Candidatus Moraniibacteriota bacterium]
MNKKKHIMAMTGVIILIAGGMFYGGMLYGKKVAVKAASQSEPVFGRGMGNRAGGANGGVMGGQRGLAGAGFSAGQIISKDDTSITIKSRDGGSKIVYYSSTTSIGKTAPGAALDLLVGEDVMVTGTSSADGSIAAENIQIRPAQSDQKK